MSKEGRYRHHRSKQEQRDIYADELETARRELDFLNEAVWSNPLFPKRFRPPVEEIKKKIIIGNPMKELDVFSQMQLHPDLKEELKEMSNQSMREKTEFGNVNFCAATIAGKAMVLSPKLFRALSPNDVTFLLKTLTHEAGHWISEPNEFIYPGHFSPRQTTAVQYLLANCFTEGKTPSFDEVHIEKNGFREILYHDTYAVADIYTDKLLFPAMELFPLLFELVTVNILADKGNVQAFDNRIIKKEFYRMIETEHPAFESAALFAMHLLGGWKHLFDMVLLRDLSETNDAIKKHMDGDERAKNILPVLLKTIQEGEDFMNQLNRAMSIAES